MQRGNIHQNTRSPFFHADARAFVEAYLRADNNDYFRDYHYYRGGSRLLADLERRVARLAGVADGFLALTTSGMSAFITAFEIANLQTGDHIVHGSTEYGQIAGYFDTDLLKRGVIHVPVDFGDIQEVEKTLKQLDKEKKQVKVVFVETVGNGPLMPVVDLERLLSLKILQKLDPVVIVDNTLPSDTIFPLGKLIRNVPLRVIGLESATKFYLLNQDLGGLLFTYHQDLFQQLLSKRKRIGATPGPSLFPVYDRLLLSKKAFDKRNALIMENTRRLAEVCASAQGRGAPIVISYPNLPQHTNYLYVKDTFAQGVAPVFFLRASSEASFTSEELFYLFDQKRVFENVFITESFGFDRTGVMYSPRFGGCIRFAGGIEPLREVQALGKKLNAVLQEL